MTRVRPGGLPDLRVWRRNPFVLPIGLPGRLAGRLMARANRPQQREVLGVLDVRPGQRVLEIGYGPGVLVRLLAEQTEAALIAGADPSLGMLRQATRMNRSDVQGGRVALRQAAAERLPFGDSTFDRLVAVNNCQGWADSQTGLREACRVLHDGAPIVIAVHSSSAPGFRSLLGVPHWLLNGIEHDLGKVFSNVERRDLRYSVVFVAANPR